ncbi:MAG: GGDEF domain-containing protein, partial [Clostridia bacterium]|nr:GGDEF domain-containing protein [Clostridia bacterium]
ALDIDCFKEVNDTYGHDIGDAVLKKVSSLLTSNFRANDKICRIGGDEFVIIMYDVDEDITELLREKFTDVRAELNKAENGIPATSISAGLAFGDENTSVESLYKNADTALYEVKDTKKGEFKVYRA